eukprot:scaffold1990_cov116-Skeletonema_marinoi.AAC.3
MMQLSRVGKRSRHYYNHFICSSSTSLSPRSARCRINPSTYNHPRWSSGSSSNNNNTTNAITTVAENNSTKRRRRHRRKKQSYSPLLQITSNHPKNTNPPHPSLFNNTTTTSSSNDIKLLTRKQLLRLTPKQRSNLHRHRLQQHKDSMSYLQQARTNVRSNLNYLGDTAGSNLKKNIKTIQRLFRGEEDVLKKEEVVAEGSSKQQQQQQRLKQLINPQQQQEQVGLDWERLPSEIKQNVQSNLVTVQNWLHKATDGMIPSPSLVNAGGDGTTSSSSIGGSVATRVQQFHKAKQSRGLVMDRQWLAWNIALALLPGALIGIYLNSMQDEMKEYYAKLEEQERARILGPSAVIDGTTKGDNNSQQQQEEQSSSKKKEGMGISSALILEGGGVFDKVKMAVNDLFLGGVEERVGKARDVEDKDDDNNDDTAEQHQHLEEHSTTSTLIPTQHGESTIASTTNQSPSEAEATLDPAMKLLLQRIESLEKQLGIDDKGSNHHLSSSNEQEQEQRDQNGKHIKTSRQSPMQIRRDASLASKWSKEEQVKKSRTEAEVVPTNNHDESDSNVESSITLEKFVQGMKSLVNNDVNSVREMIREKIRTIEDLLMTNSKEEEVNETNAVVEIIAEKVTVDNISSEKVDVLEIEEVTSAASAVENTPNEMEDAQAEDAEVKGFRAWISGIFFRK